ncbi:MAG: DUF3131 domain-containing protein [Rhodobacteraceae bacterium]|jgi:hypothetical protein|uniref:DUF3131 domain-containing protein n=1 Tax=Salipiger profundus TaxID=1229727 RepID=A0A1U7D7G8_9RHOB|nr:MULTISPECIES: DUF3131 domain-containing protein [Salipiger]APX24101.1 Protein of unknown function (DUF3131) [Salipiger profundus]MAB06892.1 DUF3131 domain-containing protein [Paracoccaceae bacterium]GFZ94653.1 hypothetical protein GCM10011326_01810 [Salipiger profundus]SFB91058.1 Protein of unknown function [Salipiger profundus]
MTLTRSHLFASVLPAFLVLAGAPQPAMSQDGPQSSGTGLDAPVSELLPPAEGTAQEPDGGHFGRNGPLTPREMDMARTAWSYFVESYQPETGLVNAVGSYPSTTLWDTASYISGLVAAYELDIIDKREFDTRATKLIATLRNLDLFRGEAPNKVYNTETGAKVNYANQPGEVGFSVLDMGRMLVWLRILKERYPYLANGVDNIPLRWNYCNIVEDDGRLFGSIVNGAGETRYVQEGRLGYEEYAAKGFALWGFDVSGAFDPAPLDYYEIYDVEVPYDGRDPRIFHNQNYVLTESYLLDGLELGWDLPRNDPDGPGIATQGWRAEFAHRIFLVQQRRFEATGIITARSEHQVEGKPYFVYDSIFADGYAWNTLDPSDVYQPDRAAVASKAAIGMWALWDVPYTDLLFETVADLSEPEGGFYEGLYENGNGYIPLQTANNNGIILAALLYKVEGPILDYLNENTSFWDMAYGETDIRKNRCLPQPMVVEASCDCEELPQPEPAVPWSEFKYCRPLQREEGIAATECRPEVQSFAKPEPRVVLPKTCRSPWGQ